MDLPNHQITLTNITFGVLQDLVKDIARIIAEVLVCKVK